jgi:hypothetical protein
VRWGRSAGIAAAVAGLLSLGVMGSAQAREVSCGSLLDHYEEMGSRKYVLASRITGHEVRCSGARKVARAFISRSHYTRVTQQGVRKVLNRWPKGVSRFHCSNESLGSDIRSILCRDEAESVSFGWYDSSPYH